MSKFDEMPQDGTQEVKEVFGEEAKEETQESSPAVFNSGQVSTINRNVMGMETLTMEDFEIPRIRLVQPGNYLKMDLATGGNPKPGNFFFSDTLAESDHVVVSIILSKTEVFDNLNDNGETVRTVAKRLLVVDMLTGKLYNMWLPISNSSALRALNTQIKAKASAYWEYPVRFDSEKVSKNNNIWFVVKPTLMQEAITDDQMAYCLDLYAQFAKGQEDEPEVVDEGAPF